MKYSEVFIEHVARVMDTQTIVYESKCSTIESTRTARRIDDKTRSISDVMTLKMQPAMGTIFATVRQRWTRIAATCKTP